MFCENCGTHNDEHAILCKKCGEPLNIEKNVILSSGDHKKGIHVEIDDYKHQSHSNYDLYLFVKKVVFKVIIALLLVSIIGVIFLGYQISMGWKNKDMFKLYNDVLKSDDIALIYFGENEQYNELLETYSNNYDFSYMYMQTNKITKYTKNKLKKDLHIKKINSTLVIIEKGKVKDHLVIRNRDSLKNFLIQHQLLPTVNEDTSNIKDLLNKSLKNKEETVIYIPTINNATTLSQDNLLNDLCSRYGLNYVNIHGYALNNYQLLKIYNQLGYTEIKNQLIILVKEEQTVGIIEDIKNSDYEYLTYFQNYGIINNDNLKNLNSIDEAQFNDILNDNSSHYIVLINTVGSKYNDRVIEILKEIINKHDLNIFYLLVDENNNSVSDRLKQIGFSDGLTNTPLIIMLEKGKIVNSIIGLSEIDYYIEQFIEYGFIR